MAKKALLLISNSTQHGSAYLEHCSNNISDFLQANKVKNVLFVPFALADHDGYEAKAQKAFECMGFQLTSLHRSPDPVQTVSEAQAVFIGGGNTFRLLKTLYELNVVGPLREAVLERGIPYIGTSAGTNVATVNIKTTNDMPIVQPPTFDALNFVPFNINAHYISSNAHRTHMGESRDQRLKEFFEENQGSYLVGLREGSMLRIEGNSIKLLGITSARVFNREQPKDKLDFRDYEPNSILDFLLE